jgi:hypothetical protein
MMRKSAIIFMVACCMFLSTNGVLGVETGEQQTATAFFPEERYTFVPVVEGTEIRHDYPVQNHGTGPLIIKRIETG